MLCNLNNMVCSLLVFFTQHDALEIHAHRLCLPLILYFSFFAESIIWIYHNLFNHENFAEHLSWFQFLAITGKADMNICVQNFM